VGEAVLTMTPALLDSMRAGALTVQAIAAKGRPLSVKVSLADFEAACDGPAAKPVADEIEQPRKATGSRHNPGATTARGRVFGHRCAERMNRYGRWSDCACPGVG
jgi:hypothetical protein